MIGWQNLLQTRILLWRGLWLMILALALTELHFLPHNHVPYKAYLVTLSAAVILLGHLLCPTPSLVSLTPAWRALLWSLLVAGAGLLLMLLQSGGSSNLIQSAHLAIAIFVISFALQSLNQLVAGYSNEAFASALTLMVAIIFSAAPLWLGPWAADANASQFLTDTIIAASPLTCLAVMVDYDYLRSNWFYSQSPFGALRYHYPSATLLGSIYMLLALICLALCWKVGTQVTQVHRD